MKSKKQTAEDIRAKIIDALGPDATLGKDYAGFHPDEGVCELTISADGQKFDITST